MAIKEILVPDLGGAEKVDVIEINLKSGESVVLDQGIVTLESDKATMEVPATFAGIVKEIFVKVGDKLSEGDKVATVEVEEDKKSSADNNFISQEPVAVNSVSLPSMAQASLNNEIVAPSQIPQESIVQSVESNAANPQFHATPIVRRLASEFGIDLARITATGPKERILKEDIQAYVKQKLAAAERGGSTAFSLPEMPVVDFSKFGAVETQALSKIKKLTGTNLGRNWIVVPHVTQFDEADITELENFRKEMKAEADKKGLKLTPLVFIMKAVVAALKAFPRFNASLSADAQSLILKKYFHLGVAVDTPEGLVVPVIRDVDQKSFYDLAKELMEVSEKARQQKLLPKDMQGGCFTISSLGGIGGTAFTPIVNAPEVAILGVSKSQVKPVYVNGSFEPRLMLPLSLSYDHRVIDGAEGAKFVTHLVKMLEDLRKILL